MLTVLSWKNHPVSKMCKSNSNRTRNSETQKKTKNYMWINTTHAYEHRLEDDCTFVKQQWCVFVWHKVTKFVIQSTTKKKLTSVYKSRKINKYIFSHSLSFANWQTVGILWRRYREPADYMCYMYGLYDVGVWRSRVLAKERKITPNEIKKRDRETTNLL